MATNELDKRLISELWNWFSENHAELEGDFYDDGVMNELDDRISAMGSFAWEIGPGAQSENQLVISPGGDLDLLPYTKQIISYANPIRDWEFHYAKPPKQWDLRFDFERYDRSEIAVDASRWEYVLLKYDDGMFEIIIKATDLKQLDEDEKHIAAEIALDGILGEEVRMFRICNISVVMEFDSQYRNSSSSINNLGAYVKSH